MVHAFSGSTLDPEVAQIHHDLIRDSLGSLVPVSVLITWSWFAYQVLASGAYLDQSYLTLGVVTVCAAIVHRVQQRRLNLAVCIYLIGLIGSVALIGSTRPVESVPLYVLVILIAATLTSPRWMWTIAVGFALMLLWRTGQPQEVATDALWPVTSILLTALVAWLGSRRLYTALDWALTMTREAQKNAQEAQERRAEVRGMLKSLDEAYRRLERANEALIYARDVASQAYRFKAEFVANVSHELRTPLNLIVGFSEMLATAPESYGNIPLPREYRGDVMAVYRSARHLSDLINDVLDLSQVEAGQLGLEREPTDLLPIVQEACTMVRGLVEAKQLHMEVDLPDDLPVLRLDRTRIRQVLLNLIVNAVRFTDRGWIRVGAEPCDAQVVITVEDSGRGIQEDRLAQAFEAFTSLHDGQAGEGSGLGLAVSKRFIELHGGSMWIDSAVGKGTKVSFTIPVPYGDSDVPASLLRPGRQVPDTDVRPWVLVVDNDSQSITLLRRYLEGFRYTLAESADTAVDMLREGIPAAVIVNLSMDDQWKAVTQHANLPGHVPVISSPLPAHNRLASPLAASEYLAKPVSRDRLLGALSRLSQPLHKVLVIDDDPSFVRLVARVIKTQYASIEVMEAFGGREGLALWRKHQPDAVLLDLLMPEMSGYELLQEARESSDLANTPVIVVSARSIEDESVSIGNRLVLGREKGFEPGAILELLKATLPVMSRLGARDPASG